MPVQDFAHSQPVSVPRPQLRSVYLLLDGNLHIVGVALCLFLPLLVAYRQPPPAAVDICDALQGTDSVGRVQTQQSIRVLEMLGMVKEGDLPGLRKLLRPTLHPAGTHSQRGKAGKRGSSALQRSVVGSLRQLAKFKWFPAGTDIQARFSFHGLVHMLWIPWMAWHV